MALQNAYKRISLKDIFVDRDQRQRKEIDTTDLEPSIKRRGVIQPIIVELDHGRGQFKLIAGERRFTASARLGLLDIPCRLASDLTPIEREVLELEENIKRQDLEWKDYCYAVTRTHELLEASHLPEVWTQAATAEELNINTGVLSIVLRVTEALRTGNPQALNATGYRQAYNQIARREDRAIDDAMNDFLAPSAPAPIVIPTSLITPELMNGLLERKPGELVRLPEGSQAREIVALPTITNEERDILNLDFLEWAPHYSGLPFSFVHMDFPYGVDLGNSAQGNSAAWGGYADGEDVYWRLLQGLADNRDRLFTTSAHFMFWFSMDYYTETRAFFAKHMPDFVVQPFPMYWLKSDNKGILPDVKRGPRRIVETCLIGSRGDRFIIKPVSNGYPAPTSKEIHQSEKPEPMLRHFFQMFVDGNTRMLDPTCGSGTSLRAAESLGATVVKGLELNPEWAKDARIALRKFRTLRAIQEKKL
jgi:ParB/RepB/Spo0J family partition protein